MILVPGARKGVGTVYYGTRRMLRSARCSLQNLAPSDFGAGSAIQQRANAAAASGAFLGGPVDTYHALGAHQLVTLLECGMTPESRVLDVGCGCLRAGYWLMQFLDRGRYFGIEPNQEMLAMGLRDLVPSELLHAKAPRFDNNADFDFGVFGESFDFLLARSVWSHASPRQIERMLEQFVSHAALGGIFVTSYHRASIWHRQYAGSAWVGRSHESDIGGLVRYRFSGIKRQCRAHGLRVSELKRNIGEQIWLRIERS